MKAHLAGNPTTAAMLWKVKRADGTILGFTNHDQDLVYDASDGDGAIAYKAMTGYTPSATETNSDLSTDNLQVTAFLDSTAIDETDLRAGLYNYAEIEIRLVNWADLTMGDVKIRAGTLGQIKLQRGEFTAEIRGRAFNLGTILGSTYGPNCRADLGDSRCKVDMSALQQSGTVDTTADAQHFVPTAGLSPAGDGYFTDGIVTWTSGANDGFSMEISSWDGTTVVLFESMPFAIAPGDAFTIEPGCNHQASDCSTKFAGVLLLDSTTTGADGNIKNLRAENAIPGMDSILSYPDATG